jgi:membrane protease YdiL (CAAX protease family)
LTPRDPASPSDQHDTDDFDRANRNGDLPGDSPFVIAPLIPEVRPAAGEAGAGAEGPGGAGLPTNRLGASTFTIEGRSAPGLFVVGWIAALIGLSMSIVGFLSGRSPAAVLLILVGLVLLSIGLIAGAGSQGIERRVRGVLPYVGPSPFLVFAASVTVAILALAIAAIPMSILGLPLDGPGAALVSIAIQVVVYVALIRLLVVDTGALTWVQMGVRRLRVSSLGEIAGGALWAVPVIAITVPVVAILQAFFPVTPVSPLPPTGSAVGFALSLLAGVILAPFGEELFFRGFATTAWAKAYGMRRGIIQAGLVFALAHVLTISGSGAGEAFQQAVVAFGARVPVALALGWIFLRRGSIWASFGLHATFNAILLIAGEAALRSS